MVKAIDRDKFGCCIKCHKYLLREVIDRGRVVMAPTPDADSEMLLLNDGSRMRVSMCRECKQGLKDSDLPYLMDAALQGWEWETDQLVEDPNNPEWDEVKKKKHMDHQRKLKAITRPSGLSKIEISKRVKKFKKKRANK